MADLAVAYASGVKAERERCLAITRAARSRCQDRHHPQDRERASRLMPDATHDTLRELMEGAANLYGDEHNAGDPGGCSANGFLAGAEWALARAEERERVLRERIEALPTYRHQADGPCVERADVLAVFDA